MSALESSGPEGLHIRDRWVLRSGEEWQEVTGEGVALLVRNVLGQNLLFTLTLEDAKAFQGQLSAHITNAEAKTEPPAQGDVYLVGQELPGER